MEKIVSEVQTNITREVLSRERGKCDKELHHHTTLTRKFYNNFLLFNLIFTVKLPPSVFM